MKPTGIVRRIDDLGRIVIPKEIRRNCGIQEGDPLEIYADKNGIIELRKYKITIEEEPTPKPTEKTVHIYINNCTGETIGEDRAEDIISQRAKEEEEDKQTQTDFLSQCIENGNDNDIMWMIYDYDDSESYEARERYFAAFHDYCLEIASDWFNDEYTEHTVTIPC